MAASVSMAPSGTLTPGDGIGFGSAGFAVVIKKEADPVSDTAMSGCEVIDQGTGSVTDMSTSRDVSSSVEPNGSHVGSDRRDRSTAESDGVDVKTDPDSARSIKRRRLTAAEKEERQREKDMKVREREEKRARQDEERQVKEAEKRQRELDRQRKEAEREEEKRKKAGEREEKRRLKAEEQKEKEDAKKKKDEEKEKKDRSQMRLNAFFTGVKVATTPKITPEATDDVISADTRPEAASPSATAPGIDLAERIPSNASSPRKPARKRFDDVFQPFFQKAHVSLAAWNRHLDTKDIPASCNALDEALQAHDQQGSADGSHDARKTELRSLKAVRRGPFSVIPTVKDIVPLIQGSLERPVDLTGSRNGKTDTDPMRLLKFLPIKALQYFEDVRPPYRGTFSKQPPPKSQLRFGRNPFEKSLPEVNYEYDSEAEWEHPEEGEDLDVESEDDAESEDDGEMAEFLDDADADSKLPDGNRRRVTTGDLQPFCSGLQWEDVRGKPHVAEGAPVMQDFSFGKFKMELLHDAVRTSIDPYAGWYWQPSAQATSTLNLADNGIKKDIHPMDPPRLPLHAVGHTNNALYNNAVIDSKGKLVKGPGSVIKPDKVLLAPEHMSAFKEVVQNSNLTKTGLIEVLKKRFPKTPKDVIKDTLTALASRVGTKEVDKRWRMNDEV